MNHNLVPVLCPSTLIQKWEEEIKSKTDGRISIFNQYIQSGESI